MSDRTRCLALLGELETTIDAIERSGCPIASGDVGAYLEACEQVKNVRDAVTDQGLGVIPLLPVLGWTALLGTLATAGYTLTRIMPEITETARGTVQTTGRAINLALYAATAIGIYWLARKARAA